MEQKHSQPHIPNSLLVPKLGSSRKWSGQLGPDGKWGRPRRPSQGCCSFWAVTFQGQGDGLLTAESKFSECTWNETFHGQYHVHEILPCANPSFTDSANTI